MRRARGRRRPQGPAWPPPRRLGPARPGARALFSSSLQRTHHPPTPLSTPAPTTSRRHQPTSGGAAPSRVHATAALLQPSRILCYQPGRTVTLGTKPRARRRARAWPRRAPGRPGAPCGRLARFGRRARAGPGGPAGARSARPPPALLRASRGARRRHPLGIPVGTKSSTTERCLAARTPGARPLPCAPGPLASAPRAHQRSAQRAARRALPQHHGKRRLRAPAARAPARARPCATLRDPARPTRARRQPPTRRKPPPHGKATPPWRP